MTDAMAVLSSWWTAGTFDDVHRQGWINYDDAAVQMLQSDDSRAAFVVLAGTLVFVATAVAFLAWLHRAHRNLSGLGHPRPRYRSGWAIGAWFVPVFNLFRPLQIVLEVWRNSAPPGTTTTARLPALWWIACLAAATLHAGGWRAWIRAESLLDASVAARIDLAAHVVDALAATTAFLLVRRIGVWQRQRATAVLAAAFD